MVLESLQALLTDIWAVNAPTGNSPHDPRWCWKRLSISSLFASLSLVVRLKYKVKGFDIRDDETQFWDQLNISVYAIKLGAVFGIRK